MILLDTHATVWLAEDNPRLGKAAREAITHAAKAGGIVVSTVSFWEVGMLLAKRRITLSRPLAEWAQTISNRPEVMIVPVDSEIAIEAGLLLGIHGDPADRFLVATARVMRLPMITTDRRILAYAKAGHVEALNGGR